MVKKKPIVIIPSFWEEAKIELMKRDRILKKVIPLFGDEKLVGRGDSFRTLVKTIVGQQISIKAAESVWNKLLLTCPKMTPNQMLKQSKLEFSGCGLSKRKGEYLTGLAEYFVSESPNNKDWNSMKDEEVVSELIKVRGIGRWTAEMFLIFYLLRPNILPLDDIGLIKAISINYFSGDPVSRSDAREVAANWEPWMTVATWYLWRSIDPIPVEY